MNGHFIQNGNPFSIKARAGSNRKDLMVLLPPGLNFRVVEKPLDLSTLPGDVDWIFNFGLISGNQFASGRVAQKYEIILDLEPGTLYYFSDGMAIPFPAEDLQESDRLPGKISARLDLGDPPTGWGLR